MTVDTATSILLCRVIYLVTGMTTGFYAGYIIAKWIGKKVRGVPGTRYCANEGNQQQLTEVITQP